MQRRHEWKISRLGLWARWITSAARRQCASLRPDYLQNPYPLAASGSNAALQRTCVAGQFHIAPAAHRAFAAGTFNIDSTFPITHPDVEFLICKDRRDGKAAIACGYGEPPTCGITPTARAIPIVQRLDHDVVVGKRCCSAARPYPHAATIRIGCAALLAQAVEHQVCAIIELQRKPVPACLIFSKHAATPLPIKPGKPADRKPRATKPQMARSLKPRIGIIIRRIALRAL